MMTDTSWASAEKALTAGRLSKVMSKKDKFHYCKCTKNSEAGSKTDRSTNYDHTVTMSNITRSTMVGTINCYATFEYMLKYMTTFCAILGVTLDTITVQIFPFCFQAQSLHFTVVKQV